MKSAILWFRALIALGAGCGLAFGQNAPKTNSVHLRLEAYSEGWSLAHGRSDWAGDASPDWSGGAGWAAELEWNRFRFGTDIDDKLMGWDLDSHRR
jgi:hypothetical protein